MFRARPLLLSTPMAVDRSLSRPVTSPAPFALRGAELSQRAQQQLRLKVEREREEEGRRRAFHALPLPAAVLAPVGAHAAAGAAGERRAPLLCEEVQLQSELRAAQRARWEEQRLLQLQAEEQQRLRVQQAETAEQQRQLQRMRASLVHQPLQLPAFEPHTTFHPAKSTKPLTAPSSPTLHTQHRAQHAHHAQQQQQQQQQQQRGSSVEATAISSAAAVAV